jgi:hypothetical protein
MPRNSRRRRGAALMAALMVMVITSMFVGAGLLLALTDYDLSWAQTRSEASLLLADAGINSELNYIAGAAGNTDGIAISSPPVTAPGETMVYPGESHTVYGRKGNVDGLTDNPFWVCTTLNEWWHSGTTPMAWDGKAANVYITSSAYVNGAWRRSEVQTSAISVFNLDGIAAVGDCTNAQATVLIGEAATVNVTGAAITNGQVANAGTGTFLASSCVNANTAENPNDQFSSANLSTGGLLYARLTPYVLPPTATVLKRAFGITADSDDQAWSYIGANNSNATGIFTYKTTAQSSVINSTDCAAASPSLSTLTNAAWTTYAKYKPGTLSATAFAVSSSPSGVSSTTPITVTTKTNNTLVTGQSIHLVGSKPAAVNGYWTITVTGPNTFTLNGSSALGAGGGGTATPNLVQTLIFEPGDYFFTGVQLNYVATNELVMDPRAFASGGLPGQIRIWIYDPACGAQDDFINAPIVNTLATGATVPDPSMLRIYYAKDGQTLTFSRPPSVTNYLGAALTGNFNLYGGFYGVTTGDSSCFIGTEIGFTGSAGTGNGTIVLNGSVLADKFLFQGPCAINYVASTNSGDLAAGEGVTGGYSSDGG